MDWRRNDRSTHWSSDCGGRAGAVAGAADFAGAEEERGAGRAVERATAGFADDWDGASAEFGADGDDWAERVAAAGERDKGAAGWRFEFGADCHAGADGDCDRVEEYAGTDRAHSEAVGGVSGAGARDFFGDEIAGRNFGRSENARAAGRGDAGALAGGFAAGFAVCDAVPVCERRGGGRRDFFAGQKTDRGGFEVSAGSVSKDRHGRRRGEERVCVCGEGARGFDRQKIYRAGRGDAGPGADVCTVGERVLRDADDERQQRRAARRVLPRKMYCGGFAEYAIRASLRDSSWLARDADRGERHADFGWAFGNSEEYVGVQRHF